MYGPDWWFYVSIFIILVAVFAWFDRGEREKKLEARLKALEEKQKKLEEQEQSDQT